MLWRPGHLRDDSPRSRRVFEASELTLEGLGLFGSIA
jgi:hypothetical protein